MAAAGINVTNRLVDLLKLNSGTISIRLAILLIHIALVQKDPSDSDWESPLFVFFCYLYDVEHPLDEVFSLTLLLLDKIFIKQKATYEDFPRVCLCCALQKC